MKFTTLSLFAISGSVMASYASSAHRSTSTIPELAELKTAVADLKAQSNRYATSANTALKELAGLKTAVVDLKAQSNRYATTNTALKELAVLKTAFAELKATVEKVSAKANNKNPAFDSVTIGRWRVMPESNDIALVFRDMTTSQTRDARYAMWNGKYVDI